MNIVKIHDDEPRAGTKLIADGFGRRHNNVTRIVEKYRSDFESFGTVVSKRLRTKGRPIDEFLLNEDQTLLLGTYFSNSEIIRAFKVKLIKEFSKVRKQLAALQSHKQDSKYHIARAKGKLIRREATDTIKLFIEYAFSQGSTNADKYYSNISRMVNAALFVKHGKFRNFREALSARQLMTVATVEQIVDRALQEGMDESLPYRDVFQLAKERVSSFVSIFGKSDVIEQAIDHEERKKVAA